MPTTKVPIGVASATGYSVSTAALVLAIIAFLTGDRSEQTLGTIAAGTFALLTLLATQLGRFWQAKEKIRAAATVEAAARSVPESVPLQPMMSSPARVPNITVNVPAVQAPAADAVPEGAAGMSPPMVFDHDDLAGEPESPQAGPEHEQRDIHDAPGA